MSDTAGSNRLTNFIRREEVSARAHTHTHMRRDMHTYMRARTRTRTHTRVQGTHTGDRLPTKWEGGLETEICYPREG